MQCSREQPLRPLDVLYMNDSISHKTDYHASSVRFPDKQRYNFRKHHYLQAMNEKQNPQTPRIDQQNKSLSPSVA
jgi:hypothetical protein